MQHPFILASAIIATWFGIGIGDSANYDFNHRGEVSAIFTGFFFAIGGFAGLSIFLCNREKIASDNYTSFGMKATVLASPGVTALGLGCLYGTISGPWWNTEPSNSIDYWIFLVAVGLAPSLVLFYEDVQAFTKTLETKR